jgi:hypothetical protein
MLKELKLRIFNKKDSKKVTIKCNEVLTQLKTTKGHTSKNVIKRTNSFINGIGSIPNVSVLVETNNVHVTSKFCICSEH